MKGSEFKTIVLFSMVAIVISFLISSSGLNQQAFAAITITARPFNDFNEDKLLQQGEPFIGGWTMTLNGTLTNGTKVAPVSIVTPAGCPTCPPSTAVFTKVSPGTYTLTSTVLPGYVADTPTQIKGIVASTTSLTFNFGNIQPRTVTARPFADTNGNGLQNSGETQLNGWTVSLTGNLSNGTVISPRVGVSANLAGAVFSNVYPGTYSLIETNQAGFTQSTPNPASVTITSNNPQVPFGNTQAGTITAMPFNDTNKNGVQDSGEPQLSGWTFTLTGTLTNGTVISPKVLVSSPTAVFSNLPPGTYTLSETSQSGFANSTANPVRNIAVAANAQTFSFGTYPAASCNVAISALPLYNVGQNVRINSTVTGVSSPTYQWNVTGSKIKDYQELTSAPFSTTPMAPSDLQGNSLSFYWLPNTNQIYPNNATVTHSVSVSINGGLCFATTNVKVERNVTNSSRNANYWYVVASHPVGNTSAILTEHMTWHLDNVIIRANYSGSLFFNFHHQFISNYNSWRALMGYQSPVPVWNPANPYPTGPDVDYPGRNVWVSHPLLSWFTIAGGTAQRPTAKDNGFAEPCDTQSGQKKLADFPADGNLLGCAFTNPYHNGIHWLAGGVMREIGKSPTDPLFWRWHAFADQVMQNRSSLVTTASGPLIALSDSTKQSLVSTGGTASPPQVSWQYPYLLYPYLVKFPSSITVIFGETVRGVSAGDLTVDGSQATSVTGSGHGPYVFTGFHTPQIGTVQVKVAPGHITGLFSNPFAGTSWSYQLLNPNADDDNDGLSNYQEVVIYHTNPEVIDTMMDGVSDGYKVANSCLNPLVSYGAPEDYFGNTIPGTSPVQSHHAGLTVIEAYQQGINPCK